MKIDFDDLETELKHSPNTTISSMDGSVHNLGYEKLANRTNQHFNKQLKFTTYQEQYQSRLNKKSLQSYTQILKINEESNKLINIVKNSPASPKKFAYIKTIEEMKGFIEEMDKADVMKEQRFFNKQNKDNKNNFNFSLKDLLQQNKPKKQQDKIQIITDRLYYQSQRRDNNHTNACCKRKECKAILTTEKRQQAINLRNYTGQPHRDDPIPKSVQSRLHRSLQSSLAKSVDSSFSTQSKDRNEVYLRLYEDWKVRQANNQKLGEQIYRRQLQKSYVFNPRGRVKTEAQQKYLKNYRGFYQRLDQLVQVSQNKSRLYEQLNLSSSGQILFKPNQSTYKLSRQSRSRSNSQTYKELSKRLVILSTKNMKCSKSKCHQNQQKLIKQLKKSQEKITLNQKSIQIIYEHEKKFLSDMKEIFYDKKNQRIKLNERKIAQLGEKEFEILFNLINKIQNRPNQIKNEKMLEKQISSFYKNLDTAQRQQLRRLEILKACKAKGRRYQTNIKKPKQKNGIKTLHSFINSDEKNRLQQSDTRNKSFISSQLSQSGVDYCEKLSEYI